MHVTFHGATREVTGSFHTLSTEKDMILLDCGLFQGRRKETEEKNRVLEVDPQAITNAVLSHAHIDHSGRLPVITGGGFKGRVFSTRATADACAYLLRDAAKIQEGDAAYLNYKTARNFLAKVQAGNAEARLPKDELHEIGLRLRTENQNLNVPLIENILRQHQLEVIRPLYSIQDAEEALEFFEGVPYRHPVVIGNDLTCTLYDAGHILGSAMAVIHHGIGSQRRTVMFTGDVGRFGKPITEDPTLQFAEEDRDIDLLIMESTYGDRLHDPVVDMKPALRKVVEETYARGGSVLIPAFAFGRTQELIYFLHELYMAGELPKIPVFIDSPLATDITNVFGEHPETYDSDTHHTFLQNGINPFRFPELKFINSVEDSMALNRDERPHIVLSGSGMCEGGRILHHLRYKIHDERNTVLIVGYMGQNTLGRRIQELGEAYEEEGRKGAPPVLSFFNKEYPLRARVKTIGGFSAHGDRDELTRLLTESNLRIRRIALVHGEEEQSLAYAEYLRQRGFEVTVPCHGESVSVG
jgi:metallo-beta-lactamase family protein